jgi:hypothetical protein
MVAVLSFSNLPTILILSMRFFAVTAHLPMCIFARRVEHEGSAIMANRKNKILGILASSLLLVSASVWGASAAQKDSAPKLQNKLALAEEHVKQLLLIMQTDAHGKISKQQYMKFMEAEFERLDKDKSGELDVKLLTQSTVTASRHFVGK